MENNTNKKTEFVEYTCMNCKYLATCEPNPFGVCKGWTSIEKGGNDGDTKRNN